ncbi:MAG: hypothetical protein AAFZ15_11485 [Bacteroidota bacterium]
MQVEIKNINTQMDQALVRTIREHFEKSWWKNWPLKRMEVYIYQKNKNLRSIGIACNTGDQLYFNNAFDLDFEQAFYSALYKLEQQIMNSTLHTEL